MTETNGRAAVVDATSTRQVASAMSLGVVIVPRVKK